MTTNLIEHFNIKTTTLKKGYAVIEMDITEATHQPYGVVHGGMNAVLVETVASIGANYVLESGHTVGLEVNVNHVKAKSKGKLIARGKACHIGRSTQVWEAHITDEHDDLIAIGRITLQNIKRT